MKAIAERKTYAGHGKPQEFVYLGRGTAQNAEGVLAKVGMGPKGLTIFSVASGEDLTPTGITGNTKFWALPADMAVERTAVEVDGLQPLVDKLNEATRKLEAMEARMAAVEADAAAVAAAHEAQMAAAQAERDEAVGSLQEQLKATKEALRHAIKVSVPAPTVAYTDAEPGQRVSLSVDAVDALLEEMTTAARDAHEKAERIRRNAKASQKERLYRATLLGIGKTASYFREKLEGITE
jgi:hypothetical protein